MSGELNSVADKMKEMLIAEYVRTHPGITESQVVVRSVNGKAVCDTITNMVTQSPAGRATQRKLEKESLDEHLEATEDDRYSSCLVSITSSKSLLDYLVKSPHAKFGEVEKNDSLAFLERFRSICATRTKTAKLAKQSFMDMMDGTIEAAKSRIRSETTIFFEAAIEQMKAQGAIFKREFQLGNGFCGCIQKHVKSLVPDAKPMLNKGTATKVTQAYGLAKLGVDDEAPDLKGDEYEGLKQTIDDMQIHLDKRRIQFESIEKVVAFLEEIVERIKQAKEAEEPKKEEKKKGRGMAFASKLFGGGKRR